MRPLTPRQRCASVPPLNRLGTAQAPTLAEEPGLLLAAAAAPLSAQRCTGGGESDGRRARR